LKIVEKHCAKTKCLGQNVTKFSPKTNFSLIHTPKNSPKNGICDINFSRSPECEKFPPIITLLPTFLVQYYDSDDFSGN
jgi:hypothetical protein